MIDLLIRAGYLLDKQMNALEEKHQNQAVIVHAFIKKSQKTPQKEIQTALKRVALLTKA